MYRTFIYSFIIISFVQHSALLSTCNELPPEGISPLFTFGHSILDPHTVALAQEFYFIKQKPHSACVALTSLYWGITKRITTITSLTVFSQTPSLGPITLPGTKRGLGDFYMQANYLLYKDKAEDHRYRIIATNGIYFPTSTVTERTFFTYNVPRFFFGITQDAMTHDWFLYSDFGTIITTKKHKRKFGNIVLFNTGGGKIVCFEHERYFTLFLELSDFYFRPDRVQGVQDLTTGGNILLLGPTVRFETKHLLFQGGVQFQASKFLRNKYDAVPYVIAFFASYSF